MSIQRPELTQRFTTVYCSSAVAPYSLRVNSATEVLCSNLSIFEILSPFFFHIRTVQLEIIEVFIYSPTEALVSCLKNNIKIYIKTAPTCS